MLKKSLAILLIVFFAALAWAGTGTLTDHGFIYKSKENARGAAEKALFDAGMDRIDTRLGRVVYVGDPDYGTLATAVASLNAVGTDCTLILPVGTHSVAADLTLNSNIHLQAQKGATFAIATTKTLTINGPFEAGLYQVFSCTGTGKVVFGPGSVKEVSPEWWGAVSDDTTDCYAAFTAALTTGLPVKCTYGTYKIVGDLTLIEGGIVGASWGTAADAQKTVLKFYNCTDTARGVINTRVATTKWGYPRIEDITIKASSWDGVTGCLGHGFDIEAPVLMTNVYALGFKKSGLFMHRNLAGNSGPYSSVFTNVEVHYSGEHGIRIGTGANATTFINCAGKYSGSTGCVTTDGTGVSPDEAGNYDGLIVGIADDYGDGYIENVNITGGNCSYNSRYGYNLAALYNSSAVFPGYTEGNYAGNGVQASIGPGIQNSSVNFATLQPGQVAVDGYAAYEPMVNLWAGGMPLNFGDNNIGQDYSPSQRYGQMWAYDAVLGSAYFRPNNPAGQVNLKLSGKGNYRIGDGAAGIIEVASNAVVLPYYSYRAIAGPVNISAVASHGGLIQLTLASDSVTTGQRVYVQGCIACPDANGVYFATRTGSAVIDLDGSSYSAISTRANDTNYTYGRTVIWSSGTTIWQCIGLVGGGSQGKSHATTAPDITGKVVGDTVIDGVVIWRCVALNSTSGSAQPCIREIYSATAMPTTGTYSDGDKVWLPTPVEAGSAGGKYMILGYQRKTNGSNHVLNTDWFEIRTLTELHTLWGAYASITGPTQARTYTFPDANATMLYSGGALGTPASGTLTNCTFPTLNQNTTGTAGGISFDAVLADDGYQGDTRTGTAGENLAQWDVVYLKSDGKYWKAKADSNTTSPACAIATAAINADATGILLLRGKFRDDGGAALTVGSNEAGSIYLSASTGGAITNTAPSTAGQWAQKLGYSESAQIRCFNPSKDQFQVGP